MSVRLSAFCGQTPGTDANTIRQTQNMGLPDRVGICTESVLLFESAFSLKVPGSHIANRVLAYLFS